MRLVTFPGFALKQSHRLWGRPGLCGRAGAAERARQQPSAKATCSQGPGTSVGRRRAGDARAVAQGPPGEGVGEAAQKTRTWSAVTAFPQ